MCASARGDPAMTSYASNTNLVTVAHRILASNHPVIITHTKPDGDAIGSTLALTRALTVKGKRPQLLLMGPIEPSLKTIIGATPFLLVENSAPADQDVDLIIVVDTGSWNQVE